MSAERPDVNPEIIYQEPKDISDGRMLRFEHPGVPVWLQIGRTFLELRRQGIAEYIIADPLRYDPQLDQGFVSLKEGSSVVLGKTYQTERLVYTDDVQDTHAVVTAREGEIIVTDIFSPNTQIYLPEIERDFKQTIEKATADIRKRFTGLRRRTQPHVPQPVQAQTFQRPRQDTTQPSEAYYLQDILDRAGKRNTQEVIGLIDTVFSIMQKEEQDGRGKLARTIPETHASGSGSAYFVDGKIAYIPDKGEAIIIGDTHGDSLSTEAILRKTHFVEKVERGQSHTYLVFLGDYADRGKNDIRNLELALDLKQRYPRNVVLIRGNHEERDISTRYGLYGSLTSSFGRTGDDIFDKYHALFETFPNMAVTGNELVVVHAGIPNIPFQSLLDLRNNEDAFFQMRWNDPSANIVASLAGFERSPRDPSVYVFSEKAFDEFLGKIGGKVLVRGHQTPADAGGMLLFKDRLATVFSTGSGSQETGYPLYLTPDFMVVPLDQPLTRIETSQHIFRL